MYKDKPGLHARQKAYKVGDLRTIAVDVTNRCNMNCSHCYASTFRKHNDIAIEDLKNFFNEAYDLGVYHYVLQGGEAILELERLEQIISMTRPDETYYTVISNGWEMTVDMIRKLKSMKVDKIGFSLDSGFEEEHDANRAEGAFKRVIEAVKNVKAEGLFSSLSTVVTNTTIEGDSFKRILEIGAELGVRIDIQVAMPVGKWDGMRDIRITPEDAAQLRKMYDELGTFEDGMRRIGRDVYAGTEEECCPAGRDFMALTAEGEILPCNFCQFSLGNIREVSLKDARKALMSSKWFQGTHPVCLLGEDDEFFDKYVAPYVDTPKPLDAYKLFDLEK